MKTPKKNNNKQTCCFSFQPKATNQHRCGRIHGNAVQPILWAVCGESESWRPIKRKPANQTSIRSEFSINSFSFSSPATKRVAESGFVVVVLSHSSLDFHDMLLLLGGILVFYLRVLLGSLLACNETNRQQHHMYYVHACVRVCACEGFPLRTHRSCSASSWPRLRWLCRRRATWPWRSPPSSPQLPAASAGPSASWGTATGALQPHSLTPLSYWSKSRPHTPMGDFRFFESEPIVLLLLVNFWTWNPAACTMDGGFVNEVIRTKTNATTFQTQMHKNKQTWKHTETLYILTFNLQPNSHSRIWLSCLFSWLFKKLIIIIIII